MSKEKKNAVPDIVIYIEIDKDNKLNNELFQYQSPQGKNGVLPNFRPPQCPYTHQTLAKI